MHFPSLWLYHLHLRSFSHQQHLKQRSLDSERGVAIEGGAIVVVVVVVVVVVLALLMAERQKRKLVGDDERQT